MSTSSLHHISSKDRSTIFTAVQFLDGVYGKQYKEVALRRYLINKRKLTNSQADEVFRIHKTRVNRRAQATGLIFPKSSVVRADVRPSNSSDRPERVVELQIKTNTDNEATRQRLINDFLNSEKKYCDILSCLWNDYYMELSEMSIRRKIQMSQEKAEIMFQSIPEFLNFHTAFWKDLNEGADIGRMFVRLLHFFKSYPKYMKSLTVSIKELGTYAGDKLLCKCLKQIRKGSKFRPYDLVGLLQVPLDRIMEYKLFLDNLVAITDKLEISSEYMNKAARRIGRIASYIKKYRSVINNMHEIYKVQIYLAGQVDIFGDNRRLIRKGMISRRTQGWMARNKLYVFFLFNDILLWATDKGIFRNLVSLDKCQLLPWNTKNNPEKKLKLISRENGVKTLFLECRSRRQRDDWWFTIEKAIADSSKILLEEPIRFPEVVYEDSDEDEKAEQPKVANDDARVKGVTEDERTVNPSLSTSNQAVIIGRQDSEADITYDCEYSQNYSTFDFQGFDPFIDDASQISESDFRFYEENSRYKKLKDDSTACSLSPFRRYSSCELPPRVLEEGKTQSGDIDKHVLNSANPINLIESCTKAGSDVSNHISNFPSCVRRPSIIIRRTDRVVMEVAADTHFKRPSITISLSNFQGNN